MADPRQLENRVAVYRRQHDWSQAELAARAGVSRAAIGAIEGQRLVPSVATALALAAVFACKVEDLFGAPLANPATAAWAWEPSAVPCRFWRARVAGQLRCYPVEPSACGTVGHDGIFDHGRWTVTAAVDPDATLVMAGCDPAAGLLAMEYLHARGYRLLVLGRSSREALRLLQRGLVDVAGIHLATADAADAHAVLVRDMLGPDYTLLTVAQWQDGVAVSPHVRVAGDSSLLGGRLRWVGRESGSGARQCQDLLLTDRPAPRRIAHDHRAVATGIRNGWFDLGVCLRLAAEEAGLSFVPLRMEKYELVFRTAQAGDPRITALLRTVRSASYRKLLSQLPGYDCTGTGETRPVGSGR